MRTCRPEPASQRRITSRATALGSRASSGGLEKVLPLTGLEDAEPGVIGHGFQNLILILEQRQRIDDAVAEIGADLFQLGHHQLPDLVARVVEGVVGLVLTPGDAVVTAQYRRISAAVRNSSGRTTRPRRGGMTTRERRPE